VEGVMRNHNMLGVPTRNPEGRLRKMVLNRAYYWIPGQEEWNGYLDIVLSALLYHRPVACYYNDGWP
jgi:hypothetical protein